MNCLLDTHVFLWALFEPERLAARAADLISRADNTVMVSVVSFWEISLKASLGKLSLRGVEPDELPPAALDMGLEILNLGPEEAASFHRLPRLSHKDPFDRLIAWQAINRRLVLITKDKRLAEYGGFGLKAMCP